MTSFTRAHTCRVAVLLAAVLAIAPALAQQADQDSVFNQAVDAYKQNQFTQAIQKFQQVTNSHTQEAQQYIQKMKAYREAIDVAKSAIDRSPDERDANSLDYAIQRLEQAIEIKPDGPWDPNGLLAKARDLRAQFEKKNADRNKSLDADFCTKATAAAEEHHYTEAARFICAVANDNPGYQCGGDEAVHLCQVNTELAKIDKSSSAPNAPADGEVATHSPSLDKAIAAYEKNDLDEARRLFQQLDGNPKSLAENYLEKISRYNDAMATGEKLARNSQYEQARASYLSAASIKSDGPGDPQKHASTMELFLGLDQFYSGDYASAIPSLQDCVQTSTQKQSLVRFYLGASELARFFVTGSEDATLHQNALNDLKLAKQAGFKVTDQDVSPKIMKVYNDISY
jgi:tetratricopeptide (TPR) repeat protein